MREIVIDSDASGQRADVALARLLGRSRAEVRRLIEQGGVRRQAGRLHKGDTLSAGERLLVNESALDVSVVAQPELPLRLSYQDDHLVVADKPAGMPSHPLSAGEGGCLANALVARFPEMAQLGYDSRQAGLVNRLDNDTSGLVLAARSAHAWQLLRELLRAGGMEKRYLALTHAAVAPGDITASLEPRGRRVAVAAQGHPARTHVLGCEALGDGRFLVEVSVAHAYRHQIRVHLAHVGAPLVGDTLYGGSEAAHHYLHASHISFASPFTGSMIAVHSAAPGAWELPRGDFDAPR